MRFLLIVFAAAAAFAQTPPPDMPLTAEERTAILTAAADRIERSYVDAAKAKKIAAALRAAMTTAPVAEARSALALVPPVNRVLRDASGDAHLRFGYSHEPETGDDDAPETAEERARTVAEARRNGFGIHGVQRLEGNVGLLTWMKSHEPELAGDAVSAAMALLASTDALVIDLRNSEGGSPAMVTFLLGYFVPAGDPVLVSTLENRYKGTTEQMWTPSYVPGARYAGKDVYILTSKRTWSAGEGFAEHMRRVAHATLVGETTRGGAHPSRWFHVHPNFAVSVPVARHVAPPEIQDWEGVGVAPDVAVAEKEALRTAHLLALRKLREKAADAETREFLDWSIGNVEKQ